MSTIKINRIYCGTDAKNTGICDCFLDPKLFVGAILTPKGRVLTAAEIADIQATLESLVQTNKANRIFPVQNFVAITDNSADPTEQTFGYGSIEPVKEGSYNWVFQFRQGGVNLSNNLRTFNGLTAKYSVLLIENQNILVGTKKLDVNGEIGMGGIPLEVLYTFPWKANDGTNLASYRTRFSFRPEHINENIAFCKIDPSTYLLAELVGLEDIELTIEDVEAGYVVVSATTDCGSNNLYEEFADEIANEEAWIVKDINGDEKTVVVAKEESANGGEGGWRLTYASPEDGDTIQLAAPTVLAVAPVGVSGFESNVVTVEEGS